MRISALAITAVVLAAPAAADPSAGSAEIQRVQVYGAHGEKLGEASEVRVGETGRVEGLVVRAAIDGEHGQVVVPLDRIEGAAGAERKGEKKIVVAATKDEFKAMPKALDAVPDTRASKS
jgi:hypothetical protein